MGGIVRSIISPSQQRAKEAKRELQAATAARESKLAKQREEEDIVAQARKKKRKSTRTRITGPLGLTGINNSDGNLLS